MYKATVPCSRGTFRFQDLEHHLGDPTSAVVAIRLGISRRRVFRLRNRGLSPFEADELAVAAGMHPADVWPDWSRYGSIEELDGWAA
jgi:hypothetical protein